MNQLFQTFLLSSVLTVSLSCSADKEADKFVGAAAATPEATPTPTAATGTSDSQSGDDNGLYTAYDGVTPFSILLPGFQTYKAQDQSTVKIEELSVTLSESTITSLIATEKENTPTFDETAFRRAMQRERKAYRLTPLKAGTAVLSITGRGGPGGVAPGGAPPQGGKGNGGSVWKTAQTITVHVAAYTPEMVDVGKQRYTRAGSETARPCKSCHETGVSGAPPHELGRVNEISDTSVKEWITTGKYADRVAKIPHAWTFTSASEEQGVVAYLRSKQTNDLEALTKLEIEDQIANGGFRIPGQRPATSNTTTP